jgi:hypothetical protein
MIGSAMAKRAWGLAVMFVAGCSRGEAMPGDGRVWVAGSRAEGATAIQSAWLARLALADGALLGENWPGRTVAAAHQGITGIALSPAGVAPIGVFRDTIRFGDVTLSATPTDAGPPLDATAFLVLLRPY